MSGNEISRIPWTERWLKEAYAERELSRRQIIFKERKKDTQREDLSGTYRVIRHGFIETNSKEIFMLEEGKRLFYSGEFPASIVGTSIIISIRASFLRKAIDNGFLEKIKEDKDAKR